MNAIESRLQRALDTVARRSALGVALGLDVGGKRYAAVAAGFSDLGKTTAFTPDHLFQIGSQTKMFVAAGILMLIKDGVLALDDDINAILPEAHSLTGGLAITVEQLLTHSSGVGNYTETNGLRGWFMAGWPVPTYTDDDLLTLAKALGFAFLPGKATAYSNTGYILLGRIIERLSGEPSTVFLKRRLLDPLGMSDTYFARSGVWPRERTATGGIIRRASPFGDVPQSDDPVDMSWASSAGDGISTLAQMLRFTNALMGHDSPLPIRLEDFIANPRPSSAPWASHDRFQACGYGILQGDFNGRTWWGHAGGAVSHLTSTYCCPALDASISITTTSIVDPKAPEKTEPVRDYIRLTLSLAAAEAELIAAS